MLPPVSRLRSGWEIGGSLGFDYAPCVPHIVVATRVGLAGAWAGKRVSHRTSDALFCIVFKSFVTALAPCLMFQAVVAWSVT